MYAVTGGVVLLKHGLLGGHPQTWAANAMVEGVVAFAVAEVIGVALRQGHGALWHGFEHQNKVSHHRSFALTHYAQALAA
eukprot:m.29672 g.29672  ORF g.29672 m.29672 type:complete len:80 (+) comp9192_c1_seq1:372-611(+)